MEPNQNHSDGPSPGVRSLDTIDVADLARLIWRGKWWVGASVVAFGALFWGIALNMTPVYRASAVLAAATPDRGVGAGLTSAMGSLGGLAALAGLNVSSGATPADESLAVLRSREFTERFIADRKLLPRLFPQRWDHVNGRWAVPPNRQPTLGQGFRYFDESVRSVLRDKKTGLIDLQIDWTNRDEAADWANDLVRRLNAEMRSRAVAKSDAALVFLRRELEQTPYLESKDAINRLVEVQINQRMIASVTEEFAFALIDRAVAPEEGEIVRPNRPIMVAVGLLLGFSLGVAGVLISYMRTRTTRGLSSAR